MELMYRENAIEAEKYSDVFPIAKVHVQDVCLIKPHAKLCTLHENCYVRVFHNEMCSEPFLCSGVFSPCILTCETNSKDLKKEDVTFWKNISVEKFPITEDKSDASTCAESYDKSIETYVHEIENIGSDVQKFSAVTDNQQHLSESHKFEFNSRITECLGKLGTNFTVKKTSNSQNLDFNNPSCLKSLLENAERRMFKLQAQVCSQRNRNFTGCNGKGSLRDVNSVAIDSSNAFGRVIKLVKTPVCRMCHGNLTETRKSEFKCEENSEVSTKEKKCDVHEENSKPPTCDKCQNIKPQAYAGKFDNSENTAQSAKENKSNICENIKPQTNEKIFDKSENTKEPDNGNKFDSCEINKPLANKNKSENSKSLNVKKNKNLDQLYYCLHNSQKLPREVRNLSRFYLNHPGKLKNILDELDNFIEESRAKGQKGLEIDEFSQFIAMNYHKIPGKLRKLLINLINNPNAYEKLKEYFGEGSNSVDECSAKDIVECSAKDIVECSAKGIGERSAKSVGERSATGIEEPSAKAVKVLSFKGVKTLEISISNKNPRQRLSRFDVHLPSVFEKAKDCADEESSPVEDSGAKEDSETEEISKFIAVNDCVNHTATSVKTTDEDQRLKDSFRKLKACAYCKTEETFRKEFKKCSRCRDEHFPEQHYYCSRECLMNDWFESHAKEHIKFKKRSL